MNTRALTVLTLSICASLGACSSSAGGTGDGTPIGDSRSAIIKGEPSDASQDAVVLLVYYNPSADGVASCSGTLIAPNLILTARHCVADTDEAAACKADGTPLQGGAVRGNHPASDLYVFVGKDRPDFRHGDVKPTAQGAKILDDGGKSLCNHDVALVLLKDPIPNAQIMPLRLDGDVTKGEKITSVGWGVTEKTPMPMERQQRSGVSVIDVGPNAKAFPALPDREFEVGESICSGDSGGPAIDEETHAVIGVVSRGGNMNQPDQNDPSATCIGAENIYTKVAPFKDFILQGFELANAEPWVEGGPDPRKLKPGNACSDNSDCRSNLCLTDPAATDGSTACAQSCSDDSECSDGQKCVTEGDNTVCRTPKVDPPKNAGGVCSYAPPSRTQSGGVLFALAAVAVGAVRRRRRS